MNDARRRANFGDHVVSQHIEQLTQKLNALEDELKRTCTTLDFLSTDYVRMSQRLETVEMLLYEQQETIAMLVNFYRNAQQGSSQQEASATSPYKKVVASESQNFLDRAAQQLCSPSLSMSRAIEEPRSRSRLSADEAFYRSLNSAHRESPSIVSESDTELKSIWESAQSAAAVHDPPPSAAVAASVASANDSRHSDVFSSLDYINYRKTTTWCTQPEQKDVEFAPWMWPVGNMSAALCEKVAGVLKHDQVHNNNSRQESRRVQELRDRLVRSPAMSRSMSRTHDDPLLSEMLADDQESDLEQQLRIAFQESQLARQKADLTTSNHSSPSLANHSLTNSLPKYRASSPAAAVAASSSSASSTLKSSQQVATTTFDYRTDPANNCYMLSADKQNVTLQVEDSCKSYDFASSTLLLQQANVMSSVRSADKMMTGLPTMTLTRSPMKKNYSPTRISSTNSTTDSGISSMSGNWSSLEKSPGSPKHGQQQQVNNTNNSNHCSSMHLELYPPPSSPLAGARTADPAAAAAAIAAATSTLLTTGYERAAPVTVVNNTSNPCMLTTETWNMQGSICSVASTATTPLASRKSRGGERQSSPRVDSMPASSAPSPYKKRYNRTSSVPAEIRYDQPVYYDQPPYSAPIDDEWFSRGVVYPHTYRSTTPSPAPGSNPDRVVPPAPAPDHQTPATAVSNNNNLSKKNERHSPKSVASAASVRNRCVKNAIKSNHMAQIECLDCGGNIDYMLQEEINLRAIENDHRLDAFDDDAPYDAYGHATEDWRHHQTHGQETPPHYANDPLSAYYNRQDCTARYADHVDTIIDDANDVGGWRRENQSSQQQIHQDNAFGHGYSRRDNDSPATSTTSCYPLSSQVIVSECGYLSIASISKVEYETTPATVYGAGGNGAGDTASTSKSARKSIKSTMSSLMPSFGRNLKKRSYSLPGVNEGEYQQPHSRDAYDANNKLGRTGSLPRMKISNKIGNKIMSKMSSLVGRKQASSIDQFSRRETIDCEWTRPTSYSAKFNLFRSDKRAKKNRTEDNSNTFVSYCNEGFDLTGDMHINQFHHHNQTATGGAEMFNNEFAVSRALGRYRRQQQSQMAVQQGEEPILLPDLVSMKTNIDSCTSPINFPPTPTIDVPLDAIDAVNEEEPVPGHSTPGAAAATAAPSPDEQNIMFCKVSIKTCHDESYTHNQVVGSRNDDVDDAIADDIQVSMEEIDNDQQAAPCSLTVSAGNEDAISPVGYFSRVPSRWQSAEESIDTDDEWYRYGMMQLEQMERQYSESNLVVAAAREYNQSVIDNQMRAVMQELKQKIDVYEPSAQFDTFCEVTDHVTECADQQEIYQQCTNNQLGLQEEEQQEEQVPAEQTVSEDVHWNKLYVEDDDDEDGDYSSGETSGPDSPSENDHDYDYNEDDAQPEHHVAYEHQHEHFDELEDAIELAPNATNTILSAAGCTASNIASSVYSFFVSPVPKEEDDANLAWQNDGAAIISEATTSYNQQDQEMIAPVNDPNNLSIGTVVDCEDQAQDPAEPKSIVKVSSGRWKLVKTLRDKKSESNLIKPPSPTAAAVEVVTHYYILVNNNFGRDPHYDCLA